MAYRALYRTYRPGHFSQMVGQEHITAILRNQVQEGQLSHAYLFCGPRGTGKTTTAKVFSRAVNCLHPVNGEPCEQCPNCLVSREQNADIIEIDAASNTGVDDVRDLISQAQFAPLQLKKRVFIVDEVHMLTKNAFNAMLKTLEEPPAHVIFILATTEPQKLPATVISRCQRFDFHRFTVPHIVGYLQTVLQQAGASIEPDGLRIIARAAGGAMRDALSLTDQCLSFCGNTVSTADVMAVLGTMDEDFLFAVSDQLFSGDTRGLMESVERITATGSDIKVFLEDLSSHMRSLLLTKSCGDCRDMLECTDDTMSRYMKQVKNLSQERLLYALEQLMKAQSDMKYYPHPRYMLESVLLRIALPLEDRSPEALLSRIAALEEKLSKLEAGGLSLSVQTVQAVQPVQTSVQIVQPVQTSVQVVQPVQAPVQSPVQTPVQAPVQPVLEDTPPWEEEGYIPEPPPEEGYGYMPYVPEEPAPVAPPPPPAPVAPRPAPVERPAPQQTAPAPVAPVASTSSGEASALWQQVLDTLLRENPMVYRCARLGVAQDLDDSRLVVTFTPECAGKLSVINSPRNLTALQGILGRIKPGVTAVLMEQKADPAEQKLRELFGDKLTTK